MICFKTVMVLKWVILGNLVFETKTGISKTVGKAKR